MNDVGFGEAGLGVENFLQVRDAERLATNLNRVRCAHENSMMDYE
jgi:hypothetical protein